MGDFGQCTCGCCSALGGDTPARIDNVPGQSAVAYRVGVHASFKAALLARLSSAELKALAGLTTRADGDFSIALCDALATTLDVLAFYQERIANENFLRTATERRSILELARLIGYELAPGVAASAHLAFALQEAAGAPALAAGPVEIPVGTRVQSVPGPGEQPQTFETVELIEARPEWNAMRVQTASPWRPRLGDTSLWLAGVGNQVQAGDVILIVGQELVINKHSERWHIRVLTAVEEDAEQQRTRLVWSNPLGRAKLPKARGVTVHVFRQRAALFGHNAPDPRLITSAADLHTDGVWRDFVIQRGEIDLDAAYPKITPGSWIALIQAESTEVYAATNVSFPSRTAFGLSGKITRIVPAVAEHLSHFHIGDTLVLAQPEVLPIAATPLQYPLYGVLVPLDKVVRGIGPGRSLAVSGKRARIRLRKGTPNVEMSLAGGGKAIIKEGDSLRMTAAPERQSGRTWHAVTPAVFGTHLVRPQSSSLRLRLIDRDGREGRLEVAAAAIELVAAEDGDEPVQEVAFIAEASEADARDLGRRAFKLSAPLRHCYDRATVRINANVARANHGETVSEILGSGDARAANASFALRQSPLTYVTSAANPSGRQSTLELRVNDLLWQEVPSLVARGPTERVYEIAIDSNARASVHFGDGMEGARPPSGDHNIRSRYRKGLGLAGNVAAGKLTSLLSRPLGVTGASNPEAASGGEDPEHQEKARDNAPLTVRTLDRAVSIRDYQDFAQAYPGIAKAHALWITSGRSRGVFLTVAGEQGAAVRRTSDTYRNLQAALHRYGDPLMPIRLASYSPVRFVVRLTVKVQADADAALVLPAIRSRLAEVFGFDRRRLGQGTSVDEVTAVAQAVAGVEAVHVVELHRGLASIPRVARRLFAALPIDSRTKLPSPAELLTIDTARIELEPMP